MRKNARKGFKIFNKTLIRNTRTVCETDIHKVIKNCAKGIVAIVQSFMVMIIQSVYMVLIMLKIGDELSENIMPKVQKSGASQMNGIFFD